MGFGNDFDGAFQEYAILRTNMIHKLPDEITFRQAPFVEPISTCVEAVSKGGLVKGDTAAVMGQGLMGLIIAQLLKTAGVRTIGIDLSKLRLNKSKQLGVDHTVDARNEDVVASVMAHTEKVGADALFEATGSMAAFEQAFNIVRSGATIVQVGHIYGSPHFPALAFYYKDLRLVSARGHPYPEAMEALRTRGVDVDSLITHVFKFEEIEKAYQARARDNAIAIQIEMP